MKYKTFEDVFTHIEHTMELDKDEFYSYDIGMFDSTITREDKYMYPINEGFVTTLLHNL